jgi:hypothetical protein
MPLLLHVHDPQPSSLPTSGPRQIRPHLSKNVHDRIVPSVLRPLVPAPDRLRFWFTPYGLDHLSQLELSFPLDVIIQNHLVVTQSLSPATLSNYAAGLIRFTKFCDDFHVSEQDRMPASEALLSIFITARGTGSVRKGAMQAWLEGLELWHHINHAPWFGGKALKRSVDGAAKHAPPSSSLPQREPVTMEHMRALQHSLNLSDSFDIAVFALACMAFWGCCRLGELLIDKDFDPTMHVS